MNVALKCCALHCNEKTNHDFDTPHTTNQTVTTHRLMRLCRHTQRKKPS